MPCKQTSVKLITLLMCEATSLFPLILISNFHDWFIARSLNLRQLSTTENFHLVGRRKINKFYTHT